MNKFFSENKTNFFYNADEKPKQNKKLKQLGCDKLTTFKHGSQKQRNHTFKKKKQTT
ncbi:MAG: hypothetical protein ABIG69_01715 [Bacteroidota bacterium]